MIEPADESIELSTPPPPFIIICRRTIQAISVPQKVCLMDLTQLDNFIKQLNSMRMCATELTPVKVSTFELGELFPLSTTVMVVVNRRHTLKHPPIMSCTIPVTSVCQYRWHSL